MSAPVTREDLVLARRAVRVVTARGAVREDELPGLLGCGWQDARKAVAIARRWHRLDRADGYIVAVPAAEGRRSA